MKKVQTFLCINGPLAGHTVTEQYAGPDYFRFISAEGLVRNYKTITTKHAVVFRKYTGERVPKNVLLHFPGGENK
jgi:hypothetical protein